SVVARRGPPYQLALAGVRSAGAPANAVRTGGGRAREEMRCPSCSRLLVLRSGPAITPHFTHRPRQSCRTRPGQSGVSPPRHEQLTLFDPAEIAPPEHPVEIQLDTFDVRTAPGPRRRRRRAWLPR